MGDLTPMQLQYMAAKKENPDAILFFRLGDFYEMFFDDAVTVAKELNLTLTSRSGDIQKNPMCGVPYHAYESYLNKLVKKGYKVAICEQVGDPKAKGLTEREVVRVVTPGTILSDQALTTKINNYIALVVERHEEFALAVADVSTGECYYSLLVGRNAQNSLFDELYKIQIQEILLVGEQDEEFLAALQEFLDLRLPTAVITNLPYTEQAEDIARDLLVLHFKEAERPKENLGQLTVGLLLDYIHKITKADLSHISKLAKKDYATKLLLDATSLRNLEVLYNLRDGSEKDTLVDILDMARTAMGKRLLRKWLESPLINMQEIELRQDAVGEIVASYKAREELRELLRHVQDVDRLLKNVDVGTVNAKDMLALKRSLKQIPKLKAVLAGFKSHLLAKSKDDLGDFAELTREIERAILENPSNTIRDGNIIKAGYNEELDLLHRLASDSKTLVNEMEAREKAATNIKTLKIRYNKVFGYYIEVTKQYADQVPPHYVRKQTLANGERYITDELKQFETKIFGAEEKIVRLEYELFMKLRERVKGDLQEIQLAARMIAVVDVLVSLAKVAVDYNYTRPKLTQGGVIEIKDGRHPMVERLFTKEIFVPNDCTLNHSDTELMLLTGPNMAGKSTYMRQTALIVLMAQIGSFVPAREMIFTPCDRIFTRIGASDDLASGKSTFMVEMAEVADILQYASRDSLVILDEVGRGTSTYDGMSIAQACLEYITSKIHAKTMFATHYHALTALEGEKIKNYCVAVKEKGQEITFLRRIVKGASVKSYGIHVAKLAGLPKTVLKRAGLLLKEFEAKSVAVPKAKETEEKKDSLTLLDMFKNDVLQKLMQLDINTMTPLEALNTLNDLQKQAAKGEGK